MFASPLPAPGVKFRLLNAQQKQYLSHEGTTFKASPTGSHANHWWTLEAASGNQTGYRIRNCGSNSFLYFRKTKDHGYELGVFAGGPFPDQFWSAVPAAERSGGFRLRHAAASGFLFQDTKKKIDVLISSDLHPDQIWFFEPETSPAPAARFRLLNAERGLYLYHEGTAFKTSSTSDHANHWWTLEVAPGTPANYRLRNCGSNHYLFAKKAGRSPELGLFSGPSFPDQFWSLQAAAECPEGFRLRHATLHGSLYVGAQKTVGLLVAPDHHSDQIWLLEPEPTATPSRPTGPDGSGFATFELDFGANGELTPFAVDANRPQLRPLSELLQSVGQSSQFRHIFVALHGVGSNGSIYGDYAGRMEQVIDDLDLAAQGTLHKSEVLFINLNWQSQKMMDMLKSLIRFEDLAGKGRLQMAARTVAERGLAPFLNLLGYAAGRSGARIHLVAHSMGAQVALHVLPALWERTKLQSMFLIQGFAPVSAFLPPPAKVPQVLEVIRDINPTVANIAAVALPIYNKIPKLPEIHPHALELVKTTDFAKYLGRVNGPVVATRSAWDAQMLAAEATVYNWSHVLGAHGFGDAGDTLVAHDVLDDQALGGRQAYAWSGQKKYVTLECSSVITDHDDFRNRAVAFAHLRLAGLIADTDRRMRRAAPPSASGIVEPSTWMTQEWATLHRRSLRDLTLPGAHDAGADVTSRILTPAEPALRSLVDTFVDYTKRPWARGLGVTERIAPLAAAILPGVVARITHTQTMGLGGQLRAGCRYFDLRTSLFEGQFHLTHTMEAKGLGFVGAVGPSLSEALAAVRTYASDPAHARELIVLNFSHYQNLTKPRSGGAAGGDFVSNPPGFDDPLLARLATEVLQALGPTVITRLSTAPRLHQETLENLVRGGKTVLCLFEDGEKLRPHGFGTDRGVCSFGNLKNTGVNLRLWDNYANSRNFSRISGHQEAEFAQFTRERKPGDSDGLFLLSWTATLNASFSLLDWKGVLDHAADLNQLLVPRLESWIARGGITGASRPNILFVDRYDQEILQAVSLLNALPPA